MALIKCPECGHEISDRAESCPHCGFPIREELEKQKELERKAKSEREAEERKQTALMKIEDIIKNPRKVSENEYWFCPVCGEVQPCYRPIDFTFCEKTELVNTHIPLSYAQDAWEDEEPDDDPFYIEEKIRELVYYNNPLYKPGWNSARYLEEHRAEREFKNGTFRIRTPEHSEPVITCPACGSTNVSKIRRRDKVLKAWAWGAMAAGELAKTFVCENCGYKF